MWNAIVRRSSGGDSKSPETQFIELSDEDCKFLVAAGLKIQKGSSPRDLYCFQYLPTYYDGTPLQVLRLLEEVKAAGRQVRRAAAQQAKRQRLSVTGEYAGSSKTVSSSTWQQRSKGMDVDVELLEEDEQENAAQEGQLPELIKIRSFSMASKSQPSPVKGSSMYHQIETPVKPSASRSSSPTETGRTPQTASRRSQRSSMKIDVVSVQEETGSSRKRKSVESTSTSPLAALFSPSGGIKTPSPGLKTRRSSVLKEFESPDQLSEGATPPTAPAQPKRISLTTEYTESVTKRFTTSEWEDDHDELLSEASAGDGLVDDSVEDDERGCCDVKSVVEPILDVLQRTSSRFQNAWEEVRGLSSSLVLVPVCDEAAEPSVHVADVRDDAVDLLVFQGDSDNDDEDQDHQGVFQRKQVIDPWAKPVESGGLSVRTRRQRREIRRLSAASTWRLW